MKKAKRVFIMIGEALISYICILLSTIIRRKNNYIAFGSWCGELYNDNSRYLAEYINQCHSNIKLYWVGNENLRNQLPQGIELIRFNKLRDIPKLLRCKYYFFTQMHRADICKYNVYRKAILCLLDHGNTVKKWAMDAAGYNGYLEYANYPFWKKLYTSSIGENIKYDYITVSSEKTGDAYRSALKYRFKNSTQLLHTGLPRNDILVTTNKDKILEIKRKYSELLGFGIDQRVILYLPTYRRKTKEIESFAYRDIQEMKALETILEKNNAVLIEKNHFAANKYSENSKHIESKRIIKISVPVDLQEMLLFADIQISDYSGCYLDFLVLDRPIIHYLYDYESYKDTDSGLYYDLESFVAGRAAFTYYEVLDELDLLLSEGKDNYIERRQKIKKTLASFEDGHASEKIYNSIFGKNKT